jgi:hypothetical protein
MISYADAAPVKNLITGHTRRSVIYGNSNIIASFYHNNFQTISVLSCFVLCCAAAAAECV